MTIEFSKADLILIQNLLIEDAMEWEDDGSENAMRFATVRRQLAERVLQEIHTNHQPIFNLED